MDRATLLIVAGGVLALGVFGSWVAGAGQRHVEAREQAWGFELAAGDLVFQDLQCGERCALIRNITQSPYSHVGVVVEEDGELVVWEAYHPVGPTPLGDWLRRGRDALVAVLRPSAALAEHRQGMEAAMREMAGRPYDGFYRWDDESIYCSELVAKAYAAALGHDLIEAHPQDFGIYEARVRSLSGGRLTPETPMVTPRDLVEFPGFEVLVNELAPAP